jgi:hypothetical protein
VAEANETPYLLHVDSPVFGQLSFDGAEEEVALILLRVIGRIDDGILHSMDADFAGTTVSVSAAPACLEVLGNPYGVAQDAAPRTAAQICPIALKQNIECRLDDLRNAPRIAEMPASNVHEVTVDRRNALFKPFPWNRVLPPVED